MGDGEGGTEASGVAENTGGYCQGVGGGVELPRGINTPGVEELPQGDETYGVTLKDYGVPGADGQGRGGDRNSSSTQDTEGSSHNSCGEDMESGQEPAAPPIPQRGTVEVERVKVRTQRHPNSADGAKPKHGALAP